MSFQLVTYRTTDYPHKQHAVVPPIFLSDLTEWLESESAEILSVVPNPMPELERTSAFEPPDNWPSSGQCKGFVTLLGLIGMDR